MSPAEATKIEGWRARQDRELAIQLQALLQRPGTFVLLDEGVPVLHANGEHMNTVAFKGRKALYLRSSVSVEFKQSSKERNRAYKAQWMARKRLANPGLSVEAHRRDRLKRTPEQLAHERLVAAIYQQLLRLAGLATWQRRLSPGAELAAVWNTPREAE